MGGDIYAKRLIHLWAFTSSVADDGKRGISPREIWLSYIYAARVLLNGGVELLVVISVRFRFISWMYLRHNLHH